MYLISTLIKSATEYNSDIYSIQDMRWGTRKRLNFETIIIVISEIPIFVLFFLRENNWMLTCLGLFLVLDVGYALLNIYEQEKIYDMVPTHLTPYFEFHPYPLITYGSVVLKKYPNLKWLPIIIVIGYFIVGIYNSL